MDSPLNYIGGKSQSAKKIVELMPEHNCYCEIFCGGCWVTFYKEPSKVEVINDINSDLINFYRVIQRTPDKFLERGKYELYSRELYYEYLNNFYSGKHRTLDDVERAFRFFCLLKEAFGSKFGGGWGYGAVRNNSLAFFNEFKIIDDISTRLKRVQIDNRDFEDVIVGYDNEDTMFYCCLPKTKIRMKNEELKNIEDIRVGEEVFYGNIVNNVISRNYNGLLYEFEIMGIYDNLFVTEEHPLAIIRKEDVYEFNEISGGVHRSKFKFQNELNNVNICFIEAKEIKEGDFVIIPCYAENVLPLKYVNIGNRRIITNIKGKFIISPITKIKRTEYNGQVYNITTENNVYVANYILTHNCDPPYQKSDNTDYYFKSFDSSFTLNDHQRLYNKLKTIKGKFILTIDNTEWVKERYCYGEHVLLDDRNGLYYSKDSNFYWMENEVYYCSADKDNRRHEIELIILNYNPMKEKKHVDVRQGKLVF